MLPNETKKSAAASVGQILSAILHFRTPVSEAIVELGLWLALMLGVDWAGSHGGEAVKFVAPLFLMFGYLVTFFLFVRLFVAIGRSINKS
jgi:hypothetical protein